MNNIFLLDIDTTIEIYELALKHGKKQGDNLQAEFDEIRALHPDKFKFLGQTEMDKDLLLGNIREELKIKILDLTNKNEYKTE